MVSILLATYNGEKFIKDSIDSIICQSFKDWELLIGFNGTTDRSKEILREYRDSRIRVFDYGEDKGKAKTLNKLIKESEYEWIAIQDDDDVWHKDKLNIQKNYINQFDVIGSMITYIDEFGNYSGNPSLSFSHEDIIRRSFYGQNQVPNTSAIFKKDDAIEVNLWNEEIDGIEDFEFWLKLMRAGKKFINIQDSLVLHRLHTKSNFNTKSYDIQKLIQNVN